MAVMLAGGGMGEDKRVSLLVRLEVKRVVEQALERAMQNLRGRDYYA